MNFPKYSHIQVFSKVAFKKKKSVYKSTSLRDRTLHIEQDGGNHSKIVMGDLCDCPRFSY